MPNMKTPTLQQLAALDVSVALLREARRLLNESGRVELARRLAPVLPSLERSRARAWQSFRRTNPEA